MNCSVVPTDALEFVGVTAIEIRVADVTVRFVEPVILPEVARIVVEPVATDVASPFDLVVLLTDATPVLVEFHVTEDVMF